MTWHRKSLPLKPEGTLGPSKLDSMSETTKGTCYTQPHATGDRQNLVQTQIHKLTPR